MQTGASQPLSLNPTGTLSRRHTAHSVSAIDSDNKYYAGRLKKAKPAVYADWKDGRIPNLAQALIKAGIRKKPTALQTLERTWAKASKTEKDAFRAKILAVSRPSVVPAAAVSKPIFLPNGRLEKWAIPQIKAAMARRRLKHGQVMREMGFKALNPNLGNVLADARSGSPPFQSALQKWFDKNCI